MAEFIDFYHPVKAPCRGLNTSMHPLALGPGEFQELTNVRIGDGTIVTRGGMTAALGNIETTSDLRGYWEGQFNGTYTMFVAYLKAGAIQVEKSTDGINWSEITAAAGQYATTRLTDNGEPVQFAAVKDTLQSLQSATGNQDCMVFGQRGTAKVVYGDNAAVGSGQICNVIADLTTPTDVEERPVYASAQNGVFFGVYDRANTDYATIAATGAGLTMADTSASADDKNKIRITVTTGVTNGSTATVLFPATKAILGGSQILMLVDTAYSNWLAALKIQVGINSAGTFTGAKEVWSPANTFQSPVPIPIDGTQKTLWVFDIGTTVGGSATGYDALRFIWASPTTSAPTATVTIDIMAVVATVETSLAAANPGGTQWAVAKYNSGSHTESPTVILSKIRTSRFNPSEFGCVDLGGTCVPHNQAIEFSYYVFLRNPTSSELTAGFDCYRIYRKRPQDGRLTASQDVRMASYSGSWSYASGATGDYIATFLSGNEPAVDETYPDAFHIAMPKGMAIATVSDRLWVGGKDSTTESLYASGYRTPFRFRKFTKYTGGRIDPSGPLTLGIGASSVQRIVGMSSSLIGSDTVFIFTDREVFVTGGNDANQLQRLSRVSKFGTISPYSVAELNGKIFYLDTEMQVREFAGGQSQSITRDRVDDALAGIPAAYRQFVSGTVFGDLYYLSFAPSGATTNTRILVWDDAERNWVLDIPPKACQGLLSWFDGTNKKKRLIAFGPGSTATTLAAYEYDLSTQSQDLGTTNITVAMKPKDLYSSVPDKWLHVKRNGIACDDVASGSATFTRTYYPDASTGTSTMSLVDNAAAQLIKYDGNQQNTGHGSGFRASVGMSAAMTAGKRILHWFAEIESRDRPPFAN